MHQGLIFAEWRSSARRAWIIEFVIHEVMDARARCGTDRETGPTD